MQSIMFSEPEHRHRRPESGLSTFYINATAMQSLTRDLFSKQLNF